MPELFGSLDRTTGTHITADCTAAFLDHVLRGGPDPAPVLASYGDLQVHAR